MAYSKKTWKDRITEYPNRRELTHSDSSTELVTVARSEGTISQEDDAFSAQNMNDLEGRIDSEFSAVDQNLQEINDNLTSDNNKPFKFAYDSTKQAYGYEIDGEFKEFGTMRKVINKTISLLADTNIDTVTIDIRSDYDNYANIDISNIFVVFDSIVGYFYTSGGGVGVKATLSYTYSDGIITITSSDSRMPFKSQVATTLNVRVVIC